MIDTHCHVLHQMDDGPEQREETVEMCRIAWEDGIKAIVATPHSFDGRYVNEPATIRSAVDLLNADLCASGIETRIMPGMEVRVSAELLNSMSNGHLLPLNDGKYVLVEFHPQYIPAGFENLVEHFVASGFSIVLAHPEKNLVIQKNPLYIFGLLERFEPWKLLMQVTADSLTGESGFWAVHTAKLLLKCGLAHVIATDAHSSRRRSPRLAGAVQKASRIVGKDRAHKMVHDIPRAIVEGGPFPDPWEPLRPKPWWRFL